MNEEEKLLLDIDRYLRNDMDAAERIGFDEKMNSDASLKNKVEEFRQLDSSLRTIPFRKRLIKVEEELEKENFFSAIADSNISFLKGESKKSGAASVPQTGPGKVIRMGTVLLASAASVAVLIVVYWFFNRPPDVQQLAMNSAQNDFSNTRGASNKLDSLFEVGAYEQFLSMIEATHVNPNDSAIDFKMNFARALLLTHRAEQAIDFLNAIPANDKNDCGVKYLVALGTVVLGKKDEAILHLHSLVSEQCYPFDGPARKLLDKLK